MRNSKMNGWSKIKTGSKRVGAHPTSYFLLPIS